MDNDKDWQESVESSDLDQINKLFPTQNFQNRQVNKILFFFLHLQTSL